MRLLKSPVPGERPEPVERLEFAVSHFTPGGVFPCANLKQRRMHAASLATETVSQKRGSYPRPVLWWPLTAQDTPLPAWASTRWKTYCFCFFDITGSSHFISLSPSEPRRLFQ